MRNNCDFYTMDKEGNLEWIGSLFTDGSPFDLGVDLWFHVNKDQFINRVYDILAVRMEDTALRELDEEWPWHWQDSQMTDYTYIFDECMGKVYMCELGGRLLDPVKIIQGMDVIGADIGYGKVKFPNMLENKLSNVEVLYGS
jgi:hypothetical protein